tara:strand:+ start:1284 stop:1388 length:105 start_codon:yes stop_codon:yes gene_type:complete
MKIEKIDDLIVAQGWFNDTFADIKLLFVLQGMEK